MRECCRWLCWTGALWLLAGGAARASPDAGSVQVPVLSPVSPAVDAGVVLTGDARCPACHAKLSDRSVQHPRLAECSGCHVRTAKPGPCRDAPDRGWRLKRGQVELCKSCHELPGKTDLHTTIRSSGCRSCHDPHSSDVPKLLKRPTTELLCKRCHQLPLPSYSHAPVNAGDCVECHSPHIGVEEPLLKATRSELCLTCHETTTSHAAVHSPVAQGACLSCHSAHGSPRKYLLSAPVQTLCVSCHDEAAPALANVVGAKQRRAFRGQSSHASARNRCDTCHVVGHSAPHEKLLKRPRAQLCTAGCHADVTRGRQPLHSQKELGCDACHLAHASKNRALLKTAPGGGLCFECHDDEVRHRPVVHRPVAEGRCSDCHDHHGSVRPYGLKGGSVDLCEGACHRPLPKPQVRHVGFVRHGCVGCHEAHGCANEGLLLKPINKLCISCHPEEHDGAHVSKGRPHKVSGVKDPLSPDRELSCASCHKAHGSNFDKLLTAESPAESCRTCHTNAYGNYSRTDLALPRSGAATQ